MPSQDDWSAFSGMDYYQYPQPERLVDYLLYEASTSRLLKPENEGPIQVFYGLNFRNHPELLPGLERVLPELSWPDQLMVYRALHLGGSRGCIAVLVRACQHASDGEKDVLQKLLQQPPTDLLTMEVTWPGHIDMLWGGFVVTGQAEYVKRIIGLLDRVNSDELPQIMIGRKAAWSLSSMCRQQSRVAGICQGEIKNHPDEIGAFLKDIVK